VVTFVPSLLAPDELREFNGSYYIPTRSRLVARGRDGLLYSLYDSVNGQGIAVLRCVCYSIDIQTRAATVVWDHRVAAGESMTFPNIDNPLGDDLHNSTIAIDYSGTVERVIVVMPVKVDLGGGLFRTDLQLFHVRTDTPATFTAGDSFQYAGPAATGLVGLAPFGRKNGSGDIWCVYGAADESDTGSSVVIMRSRTVSSPTGTWSSATTVIGSETFSGFAAAGIAQHTDGSIYVLFGMGLSGSRRLSLYHSLSTTLWTLVGDVKTYDTGIKEDWLCYSLVVDLAGDLHAALCNRVEFPGVGSGAKQRLRYMQLTTSGSIVSESLFHELDLWNQNATGNNQKFCFYRNAQVAVDDRGYARVITNLRANPIGYTPSTKTTFTDETNHWGLTVVYRETPTGWVSYLPTAKQSPNSGDEIACVAGHAVPHDVWGIGRRGVAALGELWCEIVCVNSAFLTPTLISCEAPGYQLRVMVSDDYEGSLSRPAANAPSVASTLDSNDFLKLFPANSLQATHAATHPGTSLSRAGANLIDIYGTVAAGKAKLGSTLASIGQSVTVFLDALSKWKAANTPEIGQSVSVSRVITISVGNYVSGANAIGKALPVTNDLEVNQGVVLSGTIYVSAANTIEALHAVAIEPVEGCETLYQPTIGIVEDPRSIQSVIFSAPPSSPVHFVTLRRPEIGNADILATQGEYARSRTGVPLLAKRTPSTRRLVMQFEHLTRHQRAELADFLVIWRGTELRFRDHQGRTWRGYVLTDAPDFRSGSGGTAQWSVTLEFEGLLEAGV